MPIELYTGPFGSGKTYAMVKECVLPCLADDRWIVLSNLEVSDAKTGKSTVDITNRGDRTQIDFDLMAYLIEANLSAPRHLRKSVLVAVDEVGVAMPQEMWRSSKALQVISLIVTLRHAFVDFVGTTQQFDRAVKVLRDNTATVHLCRLYLREPRWWRRDTNGAINRKTGRYFKLPWLFEIESIQPHAVHYAMDSDHRKRARVGWRKLKFNWTVARSFDTYAKFGPIDLGDLTPATAETDDPETVVHDLITQHVARGDLAAGTPPRIKRRRSA